MGMRAFAWRSSPVRVDDAGQASVDHGSRDLMLFYHLKAIACGHRHIVALRDTAAVFPERRLPTAPQGSPRVT
jgi:hypothetical protein